MTNGTQEVLCPRCRVAVMEIVFRDGVPVDGKGSGGFAYSTETGLHDWHCLCGHTWSTPPTES